MLRVRWGEGCLMIYSLVTSFKVEKRKVNVDDVWFRVSLPSLSLSLSLSLSKSWSSSLQGHLSSFDLAQLSRNLSFIAFLSSDQIKLGFLCFLLQRLQIGWKITFNYFYFLTNFMDVDILLCTDPMRRNPFFPFWRKSQHQ